MRIFGVMDKVYCILVDPIKDIIHKNSHLFYISWTMTAIISTLPTQNNSKIKSVIFW